MDIRWEQDSGWPSQLRTMRSRVSALVRDASGFRIGMTNWPPTRGSQHGGSYHEMIVLYETSSRNNMELERQLIDHYRETCENRGPGAEGRPGEGWYYVYVVRRN